MGRAPRVLFYVLHLLGVGHVHRARQIVHALQEAGMEVDVIFGGDPVPGADFGAARVHHLPPIRAADATYAQTLDGEGQPLGDAWREKRIAALDGALADLTPDAVIVEAFPFGRRVVRREIFHMLRQLAERPQPPLAISSVRDILQENRKPGRAEEARDWVLAHFDRVLVHADPAIIRLDATFPLASDIADRVSYTGFVAAEQAEAEEIRSFDAIVSAGGGAFGADLMRHALPVANKRSDLSWCLLTGSNQDRRLRDELIAIAQPNVTVLDRVDNLAAHLKRAKLSISQCGYNTAMDVMSAHALGCRAVFVPYDTQGQTEQLRRAQLLADVGFGICLPQSETNPDTLSEAVAWASELSEIPIVPKMNGAAESARLVAEWLHERAGK